MYLDYIENVLQVDLEVHHIVYYLDLLDRHENDRIMALDVENNNSNSVRNLEDIDKDTKELQMELLSPLMLME